MYVTVVVQLMVANLVLLFICCHYRLSDCAGVHQIQRKGKNNQHAPLGNLILDLLLGGIWDCFHTNKIYHLLCH